MRISFVGAGNVAWHLAQAFDKADHQILEVFSREKKHADKLCQKLYDAEAKTDLDFSDTRADILIIAIPDDALLEISRNLKVPAQAVLVHTSGSRSLDVLQSFNCPKGVFYPLQTFSKSKPVDFKNVPVCIEASDAKTEAILEKLAFTICENVCFLDSADRKVLHLAAVFSCNFTNHLLRISKNILEEHGLDFAILKPLIIETIDKALQAGPEHAQTGPAVRGDKIVLNEQSNFLAKQPSRQKIYDLLSEQIIQVNKPR